MKNNLSLFLISGLFLLSSCEVLQQTLSESSLLGLSSSSLGVTQLLQDPPPITTSFSTDVNTELSWLDHWPGQEAHFEDASLLARTATGGYRLVPGLYYLDTRSYCIKAGTYGPSIGDGYVYAPLKGPKSNVIRKIIQKSYDNPSVSQREVQELIWGIIAKNKLSQMPDARRRVATHLLNPLELQQLDGGLWVLAPSHLKEEAVQTLTPAMQRIYRAEQNMRNLLNSHHSTYQQLEQIAVLGGVPSWGETIRPTPSGRWAFHPAGYFVRFFPRSYQQTRVELYVPSKAIATMDHKHQITAIEYEELNLVFRYKQGRLEQINVHSRATEDQQTWAMSDPLPRAALAPSLSEEISRMEAELELVFSAEEKNILVGLGILELAAAGRQGDARARSFLRLAIGEAQRYLVYQKLMKAAAKQAAGGQRNWVGSIQAAREQVIGFNSLQFKRKKQGEAKANGIEFEPAETVATPAVTSKQRLAISPKPSTDHTFEIRFYAYPSGTETYTKPDGSRYVSTSGHAFVGFLLDGEIQHVRGFSPNLGSLRGGRVTARTDESHLVPYATVTHRQAVSREQYLAARAIRKSGYLLGYNDCVTYVADVAETIDMVTPHSIKDFIAWPVTYVQFLKDHN